jgi:hypothetical protein
MFNDIFMQWMKDKYLKKKMVADNKHGVKAAAPHKNRNDFNLESYMKWY